MQEPTSQQQSKERFDLTDGRDELNLAEFPLASIADRIPAGQKTLFFEDQIWDQGKAELVTRKLTISASDQFGLPTALDDDVIVGLIQLTRQNKFSDRQVCFTRYQLIELLGWRKEGKSYDRLEKSLKRWLGVTLYYEHAWWDRVAASWVDESFHILEHLSLYDRDRPRQKSRQTEPGLSSFTWNEVVFRSFKAGYMKQLDLSVFQKLNLAASKRMYRFLDKRFYHRNRWDFGLIEFACEHVGLSRNYDAGQLKRRLEPAINELVAVGFLEPMDQSRRYSKAAGGDWRIVLERKAGESKVTTVAPDGPAKELVDRGVTASTAAELARNNPPETIRAQIEVFDWLVAQKDRKVSKNPAGFLVKSIRDGFAPPKAFAQLKRQSNAGHRQDNRVRQSVAGGVQSPTENPQDAAARAAIDAHWRSRSPAQQQALGKASNRLPVSSLGDDAEKVAAGPIGSRQWRTALADG
jgi:plasmid replication initiation protein